MTQKLQNWFWAIAAIVLGSLAIIGMYDHITNNTAYGMSGKCYRLDGSFDEECANRTRSRYVPMTYASGTYRRSRSGDQWRNHINRESTQRLRARANTPERKSQIRARGTFLGSYRRFSSQMDIYSHLLLKRALDRRNKAKAHMAKFETK